jgi:hypothetical protein
MLPMELAPLYAYWQNKRSYRLMPSRGDVDPVDLRSVIARVSLVQINPTGPRFTFRVWGPSHVRRLHGPSCWKHVSDVKPPIYSRMTARHYELAIERATPVLHDIVLSHKDLQFHYRRISLPLATDHQTTDMLLLGSIFDHREQLRFFDVYEQALANQSKTVPPTLAAP